MDPHQAYDEVCQRVREAPALCSRADVLGWDERTYMPQQGSAHRGRADGAAGPADATRC